MMEVTNRFHEAGRVTRGEFKRLLHLLNPVAPHMTEELWEIVGFGKPIYKQGWPAWDEEKTVEDTVEIAVQVNGKVRAVIAVSRDASQEEAREAVMAEEAVTKHLEGKNVVKEVYIPQRIYSIVVK
jgi:leucyl-tRNA synthetase